MQLDFKIHENYLLTHVIQSKELSDKSHQQDIVDLQNKAWNISKSHYNLLLGRLWFVHDHDDEVYRSLPDFIGKVKETKEFKKILRQTQKYLEYCQKDWEENHKFCESILTKLTGFTFKDEEFTVYLTHPGLFNGKNLGNNTFTFGIHEDWPHCALVYFWHEILHSNFDKTDLDHVLIELLADNELRIRLNEGEYPPLKGHKSLIPLMEQILPHWRKYLEQKPPRDIVKFKEKLIKEHNIPEYLPKSQSSETKAVES